MYAILQHGGHQYRVEPGDRLVVDRLPEAVGSIVSLDPVLFLHDGDHGTLASGSVIGARVSATVVRHHRGKKLRVFKYKPKKRYRRTIGHRSQLTELRVDAVLRSGEQAPGRPAVVAASLVEIDAGIASVEVPSIDLISAEIEGSRPGRAVEESPSDGA